MAPIITMPILGVSLGNSASFQQDEDSAETGSGSGNIVGSKNTQKSLVKYHIAMGLISYLLYYAGVSLGNSASYNRRMLDSAATGSGSGNIIGHGNTQKSSLDSLLLRLHYHYLFVQVSLSVTAPVFWEMRWQI